MTTLGFKMLRQSNHPTSRLVVVGLLLSVLLGACTDRRPKPQTTRSSTVNSNTGPLEEIAAVYYDDQDTTVVSMATSGNSLFLTGYPFIFSRWDIGAEPENPKLLASAKKDIFNFSPDPPFGGWTVDYFGIGGLAVRNGFAYSSGKAGTSVINVANSNFLQEVGRYPGLTSKGEQPQDVAFMYKAIVPHPTDSSILFGFSESDKVYTLGTNGRQLALQGAVPYQAGSNVCCVEAATSFNGSIYVAMRSYLWRLQANGTSLQSLGKNNKLQPVNVVSTQRFLYVHHRPVAGSFSGLDAGIYVFDISGRLVQYFPLDPLIFTVHPSDAYLYANVDDLSVKIYRILW